VRVICELYRLRGEANFTSRLSGKGNYPVLETVLHATVLLAVKYSAELNKYIMLVRAICEKYRFKDGIISLAA
jgi:hypothetical protein